jgi:hypothetical protein
MLVPLLRVILLDDAATYDPRFTFDAADVKFAGLKLANVGPSDVFVTIDCAANPATTGPPSLVCNSDGTLAI